MEVPVRFAIVGLGNIGRRHAALIQEHPGATLVAACDLHADRAKNIPTDIPFYERFMDMLQATQPEVVCVCTPNDLHEQHTIVALQQGSHALVEKPMAMSAASCDRMIATAKANGRLIFAVKQNRYNPPVQEVKRLTRSGLLGSVYLVQVNCFWNRSDAYYAGSDWRGLKARDGGCLFTQFSHFIDILYYLNGPITDATGSMHNYAHQHNTEVEDTGSFVMRAANGSTVSFNFTTCSFEQNMEGSITLFAEKGTVKIGGQYLNTIEYQRLQQGKLPDINITAKANDYGRYQGSMSNHDKVIQNVIDVLRRGREMMTSAEDGRAVVAMIEQMYAAALR